jgi:hypothetical protein
MIHHNWFNYLCTVGLHLTTYISYAAALHAYVLGMARQIDQCALLFLPAS